ncbi:MAG: M20/M25/M40 family metallo-hydrolase [Armatimonadetes bacterium]|nr:M20/M25/M40 family metallo-hydrolase [Armatimonadota bacterium]
MVTAIVFATLLSEQSPIAKSVAQVSEVNLRQTIAELCKIPTRHTLSGKDGADRAASWIEIQMRATGGMSTVTQDRWIQPKGNRMTEPAEIANVVAVLKGTRNPEKVIVISGHYDSRVTDVMDALKPAPGANDDASGVAVVMETHRILASQKFPCTIVFAAVTGEEQGLYGSAHLAQQMKAKGADVIAMATYDIVGNSRGEDGKRDDKHIRIFSAGWDPAALPATVDRRRSWGTNAETPARSLARTQAAAIRRFVPSIIPVLTMRNDRYGRGGDHTSFLAAGYPAAVRFTEPNEDWVHQHQDVRVENGKQYGDLPEFVDYAYLAKVTQATVAWVSELASAPVSPVVGLVGDLSSKTTLKWAEVVEAAGYEVVWRKTTDADWKGRKVLDSKARQIVLKLSKDDYLFGLRALGANGQRSLTAIPTGVR